MPDTPLPSDCAGLLVHSFSRWQETGYKADEKTQKQLSEKFAKNIIEHGIPGSGHTHANHPIYDFVKSKVDKETANKLENILAQSRVEKVVEKQNVTSIQEIKLEEQNKQNEQEKQEVENTNMKYLMIFAGLILLFGIFKSIFFNIMRYDYITHPQDTTTGISDSIFFKMFNIDMTDVPNLDNMSNEKR